MLTSSEIITYKKCPRCGFDQQEKNATVCEVCTASLIEGEEVKSKWWIKLINYLTLPKKESSLSAFKNNEKSIQLRYLLFLFLGLGLVLTTYLLLSSKFAAKNSESQVETSVPSGLSSYGGDSFFAALVANGINSGAESKYPGLKLMYSKPRNGDYSSTYGIARLLDGEYTFAYNARPLTNQEYAKAQLRGYSLKQIPIAIDSIAIFSNLWTPTAKLNLEQVRKIFSGEITNWNQINSKYESLPIVPVVMSNENYQALSLGNFSTVQAVKVSNYTEALRKVTSTPGAISFASSSLVQNQRLVKIYSLTDGSASNYINPLNNAQLNKTAIISGAYPLTRRLFIVIRQDGTNDQIVGEAMANFLTSVQGQKIVENSNFIPIK